MFGDGTSRRTRARVDIFAVDVLGARGEGAAMLAAGIALFEAVELEFCFDVSLSFPVFQGRVAIPPFRSEVACCWVLFGSCGTYWLVVYP